MTHDADGHEPFTHVGPLAPGDRLSQDVHDAISDRWRLRSAFLLVFMSIVVVAMGIATVATGEGFVSLLAMVAGTYAMWRAHRATPAGVRSGDTPAILATGLWALAAGVLFFVGPIVLGKLLGT